MRFKDTHVNPNDQRLFPFVGGLVLGGVTGAAFSNRPYYYPTYGYPGQPYYYNNIYPTYAYTQQNMPPQVNIYNPYIADKVIYEDPTPLTMESVFLNDSRNESKSDFSSIKDVPKMQSYRSDML